MTENNPNARRVVIVNGRAYYLDVIMNIGLGLMIGVVFLAIGINQFFATSTSGWDATTILIWKAWPWVGAAAALVATIRYAQNPSGY